MTVVAVSRDLYWFTDLIKMLYEISSNIMGLR